ncbi:MAG: hypothetical protein RMJ46_06560, partial [Bacteroidota bacterium]|nr:hypothetical protein [Bacteroidota bacterium]
AAAYVPMTVRRISSASGATVIPPDKIPKKHTDAGAPILVARHGNAFVSPVGGTVARLVSVTSPGAAGTATAPQITGIQLLTFEVTGSLVLFPGEGIVLYQEAAGNTAHVIRLFAEWSEIPRAFRFDVEQAIKVPSGTSYTLELEYYTAGDTSELSLSLLQLFTRQVGEYRQPSSRGKCNFPTLLFPRARD